MGGTMWYISQFTEEFDNAEKLHSLFELWKKVEDKQIEKLGNQKQNCPKKQKLTFMMN